MSQVKRARAQYEAALDGFDGDWMTDDDDDDDDAADSRAALVATPPSGVPHAAWQAYQATVRAVGFARARAPRPQLPVGRGTPPCSTPVERVAQMIDHPNTRCVNVQQPWATLLALGLKDVENRSQPLPHNPGEDHCWVAIVASAVDPRKGLRAWEERMRDVDRRIFWNNGFESPDLPVVPREKAAYPSQSVVALAKMRCSPRKPSHAPFVGKQSVWNNGDAFAWEVLEVFPLARPVFFGAGFQTPAVYLTPRHASDSMSRLRSAIRTELLREAPSSSRSEVVHASVERLGCAAVSVEGLVDSAQFLRLLGEGTRSWFFDKLSAAMRMDPSLRHASNDASATTLAKQRDVWLSYSDAQRSAILRKVDPSTLVGLERIFVGKTLEGSVPSQVYELLKSRIRFVKGGDAFMGLSSMHLSWSKAGFGKWARIHPGIGLVITRHVLALLQREGFGNASLENNLPHLIYKPPGGDELECHHDAMPPELLLDRLRERRQRSMVEWAREFGMQTLCHVEGGRDDGYTYIIGPMTPNKLFLCVDALYHNRIPGAFRDASAHANWKRATAGPYKAYWNKPAVLQALNRLLAQHGETPLREIPIRLSGEGGVGAYVACWPVGVPHGSSKNKSRRVTITLPIGTTGTPLPPESRAKRRLEALATIASSDDELSLHGVLPGTPLEQRRRAESFVDSDTVPLADGRTHVRPEYASEYIRHPDGASQLQRAVGPYARLAPTLAEVRSYFAA